jgi:predicted DNA-binding transcriptional regulator YafY
VHRDIAALVEAGVPVEAGRGPGGGFGLPAGYRSRLPLSLDEAQALLIGTPGAAAALGLSALLLEARVKVLASLPSELRRAAARMQQLVHVDEPRWFKPRDEPPFLAELAAAVSEQVRVRIGYRRRGEIAGLMLEPLGLVLKAGVWYVVARTDEETRVYRVSRLASFAPTDETFVRPPRFDLASFWDEARERFETSRPRIDVRLRVAPADLGLLREAIDWSVRPALDQGGVGAADGTIELVLTFERLEYAYADLVKLAGTVEVVEPRSLREQLARAGRELVARYSAEPA